MQRFLDRLEDLRVAGYGGPGEILLSDEDGGHEFGGEGCAYAFVGCDCDGLVGGGGEPRGVDDGEVGGGGRGESDGSSGEGGDERAEDGGVLVAVAGLGGGETVEIADVAGAGEVFNFGPVGGELSEIVEGGRGETVAEGTGEFFPAEVVADGVGQGADFLDQIGTYELCGRVDQIIGKSGQRLHFDAVSRTEEYMIPHILADALEDGDGWDIPFG